MVPSAEGPVIEGQATGPGRIPAVPADRVRAVVQVMLAIYLSPVILIVCLIGATSMLAGGAARMAMNVGDRLFRGDRSRANRLARLGDEKNGPRLIYRRQRSRSTR